MIRILLLPLLLSPLPCHSFHPPSKPAPAAATLPPRHRIQTRTISAATAFRVRSPATPRASRKNDDVDVDVGGDGKKPSLKLFELENAFEDDGENVVGTKFFGGNAVKEELYVPEEEERAAELQNVKRERDEALEYRRFDDENAFDALGRRVGMALQSAVNAVLYGDNAVRAGGGDDDDIATWKEDASAFSWETPFSTNAKTPLEELAASKSFYNRLDVAILSAKTVRINTVQIRWDIGAVWPNPWESRILLTGTSLLTLRHDADRNAFVLTKQVDRLDGTNPTDIVGSLSSQLPPRFWDMYHIGMTPSAELDPRYTHISSDALAYDSSRKASGKRGTFSSYKLACLPSRLVTEPSLIDANGRDVRTAQVLPNHGFTTAIKTMGPNKESFVPVSPIEVSISKAVDAEGSLITWSVPLPPEFASRSVLPLPSVEGEESGDDDDDDAEKSADASADSDPNTRSSVSFRRIATPRPDPPKSLRCKYSLRPNRLVATLPYGGNPQDEEVTQLRRQLYQEVVERDGFRPKLDPVTKRPMFFFWMNDAKACFTREGGLGMAVYEWRASWAKSNEVGIELEL